MRENVFKIINQRFPFPDEEYLYCLNFGRNVSETTDYSCRGQGNKEKTIDDHTNSKLGEFGAYKFIHSVNSSIPLCTEVDFRITSKKSFYADLTLNSGQFIHVKSQDKQSEIKYTASWTFQYANKYGNSPGKDIEIFNKKESSDLCIFTSVYNDKIDSYVTIRAIVSLNLLHKYNLFDEPVESELIGVKKCVYYNRLVEIYNSDFSNTSKEGVL